MSAATWRATFCNLTIGVWPTASRLLGTEPRIMVSWDTTDRATYPVLICPRLGREPDHGAALRAVARCPRARVPRDVAAGAGDACGLWRRRLLVRRRAGPAGERRLRRSHADDRRARERRRAPGPVRLGG